MVLSGIVSKLSRRHHLHGEVRTDHHRVPDAPRISQVLWDAPRDSFSYSWSPPTNDGGSPIIRYERGYSENVNGPAPINRGIFHSPPHERRGRSGGIDPGGTVYVYVRAVNSAGAVPWATRSASRPN